MSELDYYLTYDDPIPYKGLKIYPATIITIVAGLLYVIESTLMTSQICEIV